MMVGPVSPTDPNVPIRCAPDFPVAALEPLDPLGLDPVSVRVGDLDGDDDLDLAVANQGSKNVTVLLNRRVP